MSWTSASLGGPLPKGASVGEIRVAPAREIVHTTLEVEMGLVAVLATLQHDNLRCLTRDASFNGRIEPSSLGSLRLACRRLRRSPLSPFSFRFPFRVRQALDC